MKRYHFDLSHEDLIDSIEDNGRFQFNLLRNKVLLSGDPEVVETFYKEWHGEMEGKYTRQAKFSTFWHNVGPRNARVFFGVIKMINDTFVKLVTNGGYEFTVMLDGKENDEKKERLEYILKQNKFEDRQWGKMEMFASGLGFNAGKISIDDTIGDFPIFEVIQPEKYEAITKRDFVIGHIFKTRKKINKVTYEIQEHYKKDDDTPIIEFQVWRIDTDNTRIPLSDLDDITITELGLEFLRNEGKLEPVLYDFEALKDTPAFLINNTAYNSWFPNSPYGEPDTQGLDTVEDALSEVLSQMIDEIRKAKIKVLISEQLISTNLENEKGTFDDFKMDWEVVKQDEGNTQLITIVQGKINTEQYIKASASLIMYACNKAQLHPITVGITGVESIVASQESQVEREKVSMRTREEKLKHWREYLVNIFKALLQVDDIIHEEEPKDYEINIDFGDFANPTPENIISLVGKMVTENVGSMREGQSMFFGDDKNEEQKEFIYLQTKVEKDMALTPEELDRYERLVIEHTFPEELQPEFLQRLEERQALRNRTEPVVEE